MLVKLCGMNFEVIQGENSDIQAGDIIIMAESVPMIDDDYEETGESFIQPKADTVVSYPDSVGLCLADDVWAETLEDFASDFVVLRPVQ